MRRLYLSLFSTFVVVALAACSGPIRNGGGGGGTGQVVVTLNLSTVTVNVFATQQFNASVTGSSNSVVTWQVNGVTGGSKATGFVSSNGLFVAPSGVPTKSDGNGGILTATVMVTAVSQADATASGSAVVTIEAQTNQNSQSGAVKLGTSGGNATDIVGNHCCSGTLGSLLVRNGTNYILSNNHVFAKSDFATAGGPPNGDAVNQPGLVDAPSTCVASGTRTVANLSEFYNLQNGSGSKVDAAIAQIVNGSVDPSGNILLLGATQTNGMPNPGAPNAGAGIAPSQAQGSPHNGLVAKVGRTTGLTCSSIIGVNVSAGLTYTQNCDGTGTSYPVTFTDLVDVTGSFGAEGDSGSLIVTQDTADPVALLLGGNDTDTLGNDITDVLNFFTSNGGHATTFVGGSAHAVIGCTLPAALANAHGTLSATALAAETIQKATTVRDAHGPELMGYPEVQALGIGTSYDNPAEPAIVFFVTKGMPRSNLPLQVDGVRTRVVENDTFATRGLVTAAQSAALEESTAAPQLAYPLSAAELARAKIVHTAHVAELMKQPGVQGVGISSSVDSPGDAALLIYFIRGVERGAVPQVIDGLRTRVREGGRFRADYGGAKKKPGCSVPRVKTALANAAPAPIAKP
jgi:hypothetical protein